MAENDSQEIPRAGGNAVPYIDRAPVDKDPGNEYYQVAKGGSTVIHWVRHKWSGAWKSVTLS